VIEKEYETEHPVFEPNNLLAIALSLSFIIMSLMVPFIITVYIWLRRRGCIGSCWGNRREGDHWET